MKRWAVIAFLTFNLCFLSTEAFAHKNIINDLNSPLDTYCKDCDAAKADVDMEIIEHFKEEPVFVSLDECIGVALLNNFNIKVSNSDYVSAKWDYRNALAQFLPEVNFEGYSIYYNGQVLVGGVVPDHVEELALSGTLRVAHDLTQGGAQIFEAKARKFKVRANLNRLDFTKDEAILETARDYYELLRAKISIEIHLKNLYERTAQLKLTQTLMEAGLGTRFDVVRSKGEQALAEQNFMAALNNFRTAQAKLANIMGIEVNSHLFPIEIEVKPFILVDEKLSTDELFKIAEFSRDDVKALEAEIKTLKQQKYKVYTDFVPKPRIVYQGQFQGTARAGVYSNNVLGAYLDVPIGSRLGVGTVTKANSIQGQIDSVSYKLEVLLRNIKENLISNYWKAQLLKERIEIAKKQVEYASDSVTLAELRLDAGEGILIDVIQAQTIKNNARIELLSTIVDYNINQIQLLYDNGTISYENIVINYKP
ncbi:MAG: TolC family protein [Candidatus Gastranaerophilales bacterium]|nr:TolC family protein [Candidatus Gastranaerophilales bacterium]